MNLLCKVHNTRVYRDSKGAAGALDTGGTGTNVSVLSFALTLRSRELSQLFHHQE